MKKFISIFAIFFMTFSFLLAQDQDLDKLDFEEQDYDKLIEETQNYVVFGGGAILNMKPINYDELNNLISSINFGNNDKDFKFSGMFYQVGAQGLFTIGLIPNVRIGILGIGGSFTPDKILNYLDVERNIELHSNYTAFNVDYAFVPFDDFKLSILFGLNLGYGDLELKMYQATDNFSYSDLKSESDTSNYFYDLSSSFWHIEPMLYFEYAPTVVSLFRMSIGYAYGIYSDWNLNSSKQIVKDVPSNLNVNGINIQFGIFFGLFNY